PAAATVNANGTIPDSANVSFNAAGTYYWQAVYGGDVNNNGVTSTPPCSEVLVINKATPSIATTLSSSAVTVGSSVNDSAAFTGAFNPTGTVTYSVFNENTCTTPATVPTQISGQPAAVAVSANGTIPDPASVTFNKAGTYYWQASYGGDGNNVAVKSPCTSETITIGKATPSVATTLSATSVPVGGAIHDSSAFTGAVTPTGTVTYSIFNESTCTTPATAAQISGQPAAVTVNANGTIPNSASVTFNKAGTYYWQAPHSFPTRRSSDLSPCTSETITIGKASPSVATTLSATSVPVGG